MESIIRTLRHERNWSQLDLAEKIGVSQVTICKWEQKECLQIKLDKIRRLAQIFDVPYTLFLNVPASHYRRSDPTKNIYLTQDNLGLEVTVKTPWLIHNHESTMSAVLTLLSRRSMLPQMD
jgi:transcriptional regulator with XRE-family HTH domain